MTLPKRWQNINPAHSCVNKAVVVFLTSLAWLTLLNGCEQNAHIDPTHAIGDQNLSLEGELQAKTQALHPADTGQSSSANATHTINATNTKTAIKSRNQAVEPLSCHNEAIVKAYQNKWSNRQVKGCGDVVAILPDDTKDSHHQRMIVRLSDVIPEQRVLIAHNIDLAPKVVPLTVGQTVMFYGEYEYNEQGGVVHWTHHDPAARHQDGWILSNNTFFD